MYERVFFFKFFFYTKKNSPEDRKREPVPGVTHCRRRPGCAARCDRTSLPDLCRRSPPTIRSVAHPVTRPLGSRLARPVTHKKFIISVLRKNYYINQNIIVFINKSEPPDAKRFNVSSSHQLHKIITLIKVRLKQLKVQADFRYFVDRRQMIGELKISLYHLTKILLSHLDIFSTTN